MKKSDSWKQKNPVDQLTALLGNLEGHMSNLEDKIISNDVFLERTKPIVEEIKLLHKFLTGEWK